MMRGSRVWMLLAGMNFGYLDHNLLRDPDPWAALVNVVVIAVSLWLARTPEESR